MAGDIINVHIIKNMAALAFSEELTALVHEQQADGNQCEIQYQPLLNEKGQVIYTALVTVK